SGQADSKLVVRLAKIGIRGNGLFEGLRGFWSAAAVHECCAQIEEILSRGGWIQRCGLLEGLLRLGRLSHLTQKYAQVRVHCRIVRLCDDRLLVRIQGFRKLVESGERI